MALDRRARIRSARVEPAAERLPLRAPGCTCEIPEMDYTGTRELGAIDDDWVGHDLDCALMKGGAEA